MRGIRGFAPQATGPPQRQGLLCCSFCDFRVYPFIFAIVVFYFESSLQFQFLKKIMLVVCTQKKTEPF